MSAIDVPKNSEAMTNDHHNFGHPYTPYRIQLDFMRSLFDVLERGAIGVFESPTGTGKTLSLICGAVTWLRGHVSDTSDSGLLPIVIGSQEPDWVISHDRQHREDMRRTARTLQREKLATLRRRSRNTQRKAVMPAFKRPRVAEVLGTAKEDDEFLVKDYHSDSEERSSGLKEGLPEHIVDLLQRTGYTENKIESDEADLISEVKIFFSSRTHSQLTQFASELRKVQLRDISNEADLDSSLDPPKYVALASRKSLCIHPTVSKLPLEELNETCLDLQESGTPAHRRCTYFDADASKKDRFRDEVLADIRDIEDLVELGSENKVCPYYGVRAAIPSSEIVSMPYPLILNKNARESLGVDLSGNVVIIDEGHNLTDAITGLSSASVSLLQLHSCENQLTMYMQKYARRLGGKNKVYISQLYKVLKGITMSIEAHHTSCEVASSDLLPKACDSINLHNLTRYLKESKLARKVDSYHAAALQKTAIQPRDGQKAARKSTPSLTIAQRFLDCLANPSLEGRFFIKRSASNDASLEYMLLDPTHAFSDIVNEARSIILAGGTMQPVRDVIEALFPGRKDAVTSFSCGHVIPPTNLLGVTVASGPTAKTFEFTYERRYDTGMLEDLGRTFINLSSVIPDGIVIFFSSYDYLDHVLDKLRDLGLYKRLEAKKPIFLESKTRASEEVLAEYIAAIDKGRGGILFAVIGGKMSEGINFSDTLGRAVIVVGLPFPNVNSPEWKSRMSYVRQKHMNLAMMEGHSREDVQKRGAAAAQDHFENVTMRSVNQSIGRAIRHKNDYAMIYLIDARYRSERIQNKLPGWIAESLDVKLGQDFGSIMRETVSFFKSKKK